MRTHSSVNKTIQHIENLYLYRNAKYVCKYQNTYRYTYDTQCKLFDVDAISLSASLVKFMNQDALFSLGHTNANRELSLELKWKCAYMQKVS